MVELSLTPEEQAHLHGNCKKCGRVPVTLITKAPPLNAWAVKGLLIILVGLEVADLLVSRFTPSRPSSPWDPPAEIPVWAIWAMVIGVALVAALQSGLVTQMIQGFCGPGHYFNCTKCGKTWRAD